MEEVDPYGSGDRASGFSSPPPEKSFFRSPLFFVFILVDFLVFLFLLLYFSGFGAELLDYLRAHPEVMQQDDTAPR